MSEGAPGWLEAGLATRGSFILMKQHVSPYILDPNIIRNDQTQSISGSGLYMLLVENNSNSEEKKKIKNVWFKTRSHLRKGKKSTKEETEITR